jgi:hypothetical protein
VITEIPSNTRQVPKHADAHGFKVICRAESGTHQDGRTAKRASGQNYAIGPNRFGGTTQADAHSTMILERHTVNKDTAVCGEVGSATRGGKIRKRRTLPNASNHISWPHSSADSARRIVIRHWRIAQGGTSPQESSMLGEKGIRRVAPNRKRAISTVPTVVKIGIAFNAAKKGKHFGKRPSRIAACRPFIVIARRPSQSNSRVCRGAAPHQFSAREWDRSTKRARFAGISPIMGESRIEGIANFGWQIR